ncbi:MAG: tetratricopeptide repeat protein, partial [Deltaproteobacteria bacterium]
MLAGFGCQHSASPDATLLQIREAARRGQLDSALHDVNVAFARYETNPEWAARFRVQKAHILMLRGSYSESLQLLNDPLPQPLTRTDTEVQRKMVQGLAHDFLQQYEAANSSISEAEALAATIHSSLLGDVAQARGTLELDQKKYAEAATAFHKVLSLARGQNQGSLEVLALGSLGNVAMWQEHYDEAIDWFRTALRKARALGSLSSESRALGNMGWNYSAVGDFQSAEESLMEAQSKAGQAGLVDNQIFWLTSLAGVYSQQHRYTEADSIAQRALTLAKGQDDQYTLTSCLNTLSEIALAVGSVDDAEKYNLEALKIEHAGLDQFGIASSTIISGRIAASKKQYEDAEKTFQKVATDQRAETPVRWEAQAYLAQVHAAKGNVALAEREFAESIHTISKARNDLQHEEFQLSFLSSAIRFYDAYVEFLIERNRPLDALKIADLSRAQTLERGLPSGSNGIKQLATFRPQEAARRLNGTLLFYWLGENHSYLWAITAAKALLFSLPKSAEIDSAVKSYR